MAWARAIGRQWTRWSGAVKRELLRDPERVLLDLGPDAAPPTQDRAAAPEVRIDLQ